jgi:hypothetical protein
MKGYNYNSDKYTRLRIGATLYGRAQFQNGTTPTTYTALVYMAAGTYDVLMEGLADGSGPVYVLNFKLGKAKFSDAVGQALAVYSTQIIKTVASRRTPAGLLKQAVVMVECFAYTPSAKTNFENVGDSLTNGVSLSIDGVQVNWDTRSQDVSSKGAAYANYYGAVSVGSAHTVAISKDNANTVVHISVYLCPWLLCATGHEPVTLDFSQGSTTYLLLEPLDLNPTKYVKIGKGRAISFGDSTDYYSVGSGTNILSHSYTFEMIAVASCILVVSGLGGCIGGIAVDVR